MDRPPEGSPHQRFPDPDQHGDAGQGQPLRGPIDPASPGWVRVEADLDPSDETRQAADAAAELPERSASPAAPPPAGNKAAADPDAASAVKIPESIGDGLDVEQYGAADGGASRTLMFHRFDPQAARILRPHLPGDADSRRQS